MNEIKTVKSIDSTGKVFGVMRDSATSILPGIDYAHHKTHDSEAYCACMHEIDFDKASEIGILFTTPNTQKWLHAVVLAYTGAASIFQLLEAPTVDVANYPVTFSPPINRDRNSSNRSGVLDVRAAPVAGSFSRKKKADTTPITADGTVLHTDMLGSGKQGGGGGTSDRNEFILRQNTTYYFRIAGTANGADASVASLFVAWYEHENL